MTLSDGRVKNPNYKEKYLKERRKSVDAIEYIKKQKEEVLKSGEESECLKREILILNEEKEQLKQELKAEKIRTNHTAELAVLAFVFFIIIACIMGGR